MKLKIWSFILFAFLLLLAACSSETSQTEENSTQETTQSSQSSDEAKEETEPGEPGGTLRIAYPTQPQTLDPHMTTANATRDPARLIFETLVAVNENYEVTPMLADSFEITEEGKKITFKLREGVLFHNGEEMKSDDVVASMKKWSEGSAAKGALGNHEWVANGDYVVELTVENPSSVLMHALAEPGQFAAIMPKEIIESAGADGVKEYIGTGPFKFEEWKQNQYIHLTKFEDYVSDDDPTSGLIGKKEALVDEIYHNFVGDSATRVTGLIGGEYDFAHMLPYDAIPQIESMPGYVIDAWPYGGEILVFNKKEGLFTNKKVRQAVNYALDKEVVLSSAFTAPEYYKLDPGLFDSSQTDWYSDAGKELYNPKDTEKAKQLLNEAGYNGEEVVILTSRDYEHHYNAAVATHQQLTDIGINAKLDVYDWATLLERRSQPDKWDIFYTGFPIMSTPHQYVFLPSEAEWPGWTNNAEIDRLLDEIKVQNTQEKSKELYAQIQQIMWEDVPVINVGKNHRVSAYSDKIKGYDEFLGPIFWNVSAK